MVPTETVKANGRVTSDVHREIVRSQEEEALRNVALRHLEHVRKVKLYASIYLVSMLVLTPVWIVTQYETQDGWPKHLSTRSRYPGDWDPWIIWVALIGATVVAIAGFRAYFSRAATEDEVQGELERLKSAR